MDSKPLITLPDRWLEKSQAWGRQVVEDYADGRNASSRAVSCFNAESNVKLQANAKMCECAFAIFAGLDPDSAVHWARHCDDGADVVWRKQRWDVKATSMRGQYLLWPIAKNHIFDSKKFDCLVLVKHEAPQFIIAGWVSKQNFRNYHKIATLDHKLFVGTWYMHENDLWSAENLRDHYDPTDDFSNSIDDCYRVIRERKAAGGKGWPA